MLMKHDDPTPSRENLEEFWRFLQQRWRQARDNYEAAGMPFGADERGFEVWVEYDQCTTAN